MTIHDRKVLEALRDEPELLAIADAVAATGAKRRRRTLPAVAAAGVVAALVLLLVEPWGSSGPGLSDRALAAIGNGPIVHAVIRYQLPGQRVELATGRARPIVRIAETWTDEAKGVVLVSARADGQVLDRRTVRLNRQDFFYPLGLAAFYRRALEEGKLQQVGEGNLRGHRIIWVSATQAPFTLEAALERDSYDPLVVRYLQDGQIVLQIDVLKMESLPLDAVRFGNPVAEGNTSTGGFAMESPTATPSTSEIVAAQRVLGASPLWLGRSWDGVPLSTLGVSTAQTRSGGRSARARLVHLEYGHGPLPPFVLDELSIRNERDFLRVEGDVLPPTGFVDLEGPSMAGTDGQQERWTGTFQRDGLYITIEAGSRTAVLDAARAIRSADPDELQPPTSTGR